MRFDDEESGLYKKEMNTVTSKSIETNGHKKNRIYGNAANQVGVFYTFKHITTTYQSTSRPHKTLFSGTNALHKGLKALFRGAKVLRGGLEALRGGIKATLCQIKHGAEAREYSVEVPKCSVEAQKRHIVR